MDLDGNTINLHLRGISLNLQSNEFNYQLSFLSVIGRAEMKCE